MCVSFLSDCLMYDIEIKFDMMIYDDKCGAYHARISDSHLDGLVPFVPRRLILRLLGLIRIVKNNQTTTYLMFHTWI